MLKGPPYKFLLDYAVRQGFLSRNDVDEDLFGRGKIEEIVIDRMVEFVGPRD